MKRHKERENGEVENGEDKAVLYMKEINEF